MPTQFAYVFQLTIAVIAYLFGYPNFGSTFIVIAAPLCIYLVAKQDAGYLPALVIHCASQTAITFAVLLSIAIICTIKANKILQVKELRVIFIILALCFPLYCLLTYHRIVLDGDKWQQAFSYSIFYLSFWCFLYGYIIADSYNKSIGKILVFVLLVCYILCNKLEIAIGSRCFTLIVFFGMLYGVNKVLDKQLLSGIVVLFISSIFFFREEITFTEFFTVFVAAMFLYIIKRGHVRIFTDCSGIVPYLAIFVIMIFAILTFVPGQHATNIESIDLTSWTNFMERIQFKLYDDRAVFWQAGLYQIIDLHPVLPLHNIPNLYIESPFGYFEGEISFGAHNTPLELIRKFGLLMGIALIFCYMRITILGRNYIKSSEDGNSIDTLLFLTFFSNTIVLFLTGTAAMMPMLALMFFGCFGICAAKSTNSYQS